MKEIETVRKMFFEERENISNIEKESGFDRKTIRKYLTKDDFRKEPLQDNPKYYNTLINLNKTFKFLIP